MRLNTKLELNYKIKIKLKCTSVVDYVQRDCQNYSKKIKNNKKIFGSFEYFNPNRHRIEKHFVKYDEEKLSSCELECETN